MFPEAVEAPINLLLHLFHRFRRRVPDLREVSVNQLDLGLVFSQSGLLMPHDAVRL
jgi:hypothetical protein